MNSKKLVFLATKVMGWKRVGCCYIDTVSGSRVLAGSLSWQPHKDVAQAMQLAMKCHVDITHDHYPHKSNRDIEYIGSVETECFSSGVGWFEHRDKDLCTAICEVILKSRGYDE